MTDKENIENAGFDADAMPDMNGFQKLWQQTVDGEQTQAIQEMVASAQKTIKKLRLLMIADFASLVFAFGASCLLLQYDQPIFMWTFIYVQVLLLINLVFILRNRRGLLSPVDGDVVDQLRVERKRLYSIRSYIVFSFWMVLPLLGLIIMISVGKQSLPNTSGGDPFMRGLIFGLLVSLIILIPAGYIGIKKYKSSKVKINKINELMDYFK